MAWGDTCHDAGDRAPGDVVEVTTSGGPADVRLLDGPGYRDRRAGRPTASHVERAAGTPVRLTIPHAGRWYVTVDFGACLASIRSGIRVLPPDEGPTMPDGDAPPALPRRIERAGTDAWGPGDAAENLPLGAGAARRSRR